MKKNIYVLSGLGADERVFQKLDLSAYEVHFVKWIKPEENESIEAYAKRLSAQITTPEPILIGMSFGGMIAIEIAKQQKVAKVILIASAETKDEIPIYYRLGGKLRVHKMLPNSFLKNSSSVIDWLFGVSTKEESKLLKQIVEETDPEFLKWSMDKIVNWKNEVELDNIYHIHGSADKVLPLQNPDSKIVVNGGGHFMTMNKPEEITAILKKLI